MRKRGLIEASVNARVAFQEIDLVQVVWHGHYLKYMEDARWALMERLGFGLQAMMSSGYSWPITEAHLRYIRAARFGDELRVRASLIEWQQRVLINYLVSDAANGERVARGQTVQVAVNLRSGAMQLPLPQPFVERVETCLARERAARCSETERLV